MWVERITARAFGPLRDETLELGPGLNVVYGPNEAGKTSWHAALRMALTGVRRGPGSATREAATLRERHAPWDDPDRWNVEALVHLADRRIDLVQDLAGKVACRATDVDLGLDVSAEITRPDGTPDASIWLGLDRDAFAATVSIGQSEMLAVVDNAAALQEHMQRAAATRGTDATAAGALERLRDHRRKVVGADTAAAKGPLRAAMREVAAREAELEAARQRHDAYLQRRAEAEAAAAAMAAAERSLGQVRLAAAVVDADALHARAERAAELASRYPQPPPDVADRDERADQVAAALAGWAARPTPGGPTGRSSAEISAELTALPEPPVGDVEPHPGVRAAVRELDLAIEAERALSAAADGLAGQPAVPVGARVGWVVAGALALGAGIAVLLEALPLGVILGLAAGGAAAYAWRASSGSPALASGSRASRAQATERKDAARRALEAALAARGVPASAELHAAVAAYEAACRARAATAAEAARANGLRRELAAAQDAELLVAASMRAVADAEAALRAAWSGIAGSDGDELAPTDVARRLEAWQRDRARANDAAAAAIREYHELTALLGGRTVADLQAAAERAARTAAERAAAVGTGDGPPIAAHSDRDAEALEREVERQREVSASLQGAVGVLEADLRDVAAAEEALAAANERLRRVRELAEVIDQTVELLETAQRQVHRDLAPILKASVEAWLPVISQGAYVRAGVNPADLSIEVKEQASGLWRQAHLLSEGTREQIYLLLRVAMAQHLVTTAESAPMLLDEVTAQADSVRKRAVLDMLLTLAADRQLVLFSHDEEVLAWAEERLVAAPHRLIRLPDRWAAEPEAAIRVGRPLEGRA